MAWENTDGTFQGSSTAVDGARRTHASRWTVAGEKAGRQMAHVLGATRLRAAVPNPLARRGDHRLAGADVERAALVIDSQQAAQDDGDLFEFRPLAGLLPPLG